jgi:hypothetical protein
MCTYLLPIMRFASFHLNTWVPQRETCTYKANGGFYFMRWAEAILLCGLLPVKDTMYVVQKPNLLVLFRHEMGDKFVALVGSGRQVYVIFY